MNKLIATFLILLTGNSLFCQTKKNDIKYYDENFQEISQEIYVKKTRSSFTRIVTDTTKNIYLTQKFGSGSISNKKKFDSLLLRDFGKKYNPKLPLVVVYYPGRDYCNKSNNGKKWNPVKNIFFNDLEKGLKKLGKHNIFYVYKTQNGLKDGNKGYKRWFSDPDRIFENLFFKTHYPCGSYVILTRDGKYISEYGEFSKERVWYFFKKIQDL